MTIRQALARKKWHRNSSSRTTLQTYCKACAKAIDREKAAAKKETTSA
jgi:ribosomal protein S20